MYSSVSCRLVRGSRGTRGRRASTKLSEALQRHSGDRISPAGSDGSEAPGVRSPRQAVAVLRTAEGAGHHVATFDAVHWQRVYLYRLTTGKTVLTRRMVLVMTPSRATFTEDHAQIILNVSPVSAAIGTVALRRKRTQGRGESAGLLLADGAEQVISLKDRVAKGT